MLYTESESSGSVCGDQKRKRKRIYTVEFRVDGSFLCRFEVDMLLPEQKKIDKLREEIKFALEDQEISNPEVILYSVRITSPDGHETIPTDVLRKDSGDDDVFQQSLASLLAKKVSSDTCVWFVTPAGQLKAAQEAVTPKEKRAISDYNLKDLDKEFIHEWVANLGQKYLPLDPASSRIVASLLGACIMHILGDNSQCEPVVKEALRIQRRAMIACPNRWKDKADKEMTLTLRSVAKDLSSSAFVLLTMSQLSAALAQWKAKDYMNDFSVCARATADRRDHFDDFWARRSLPDVLKEVLLPGCSHMY
eukprot:jgi/Picre1/33779/NNA_001258.t1